VSRRARRLQITCVVDPSPFGSKHYEPNPARSRSRQVRRSRRVHGCALDAAVEDRLDRRAQFARGARQAALPIHDRVEQSRAFAQGRRVVQRQHFRSAAASAISYDKVLYSMKN
jgi:hypothetical protein